MYVDVIITFNYDRMGIFEWLWTWKRYLMHEVLVIPVEYIKKYDEIFRVTKNDIKSIHNQFIRDLNKNRIKKKMRKILW